MLSPWTNIFQHFFRSAEIKFQHSDQKKCRIICGQGVKYLTINFRYLPGKETRLFSRNDASRIKEKAGFLRRSRKKRYIKNF
ncbi:Uncharacterized protein dnm_070540 [Desulfonema magnum]|uniref:Uncharacterized protein n=1 Tax=Desulfonema magnum TaxID=45655 RepID=A0A975GRJ7_9BACT|nr:Uncharacterized protein dnm_070540 [Desulfonema magnum]